MQKVIRSLVHLFSTYKTETDHGLGEQTVVVGGVGSGMNGEFGVGRCKLLHLEWIRSGVLLSSAGNCVWSLGVEHDGR